MMSYHVLKKRYEKEQIKRQLLERDYKKQIKELNKKIKKLNKDIELLKELNNMKNQMLRGE